MPVALISTSTSPACGPCRSTVSIVRGAPAFQATAARVFIRGSPVVRAILARPRDLPLEQGRRLRAKPEARKTAAVLSPVSPIVRHLGEEFVNKIQTLDNGDVQLVVKQADGHLLARRFRMHLGHVVEVHEDHKVRRVGPELSYRGPALLVRTTLVETILAASGTLADSTRKPAARQPLPALAH